MKIYLDNCAFNRPFGDQKDIRIKIETEAKLHIQEKIKTGKLDLIWSYILDFENSRNPFVERRISISHWKKSAVKDIEESENLLQKADSLVKIGLKPKDALHIDSAIEAEAGYFLTTDDKILNKATNVKELKIMSPTDFIKVIEHND